MAHTSFYCHHLAACCCMVCPRGTYLPYFFTFLLKDLFLLKAPSIGSPASMAALIASARIACSGRYSEVTLPALPARPVLPTCAVGLAIIKPILSDGRSLPTSDAILPKAPYLPWNGQACTGKSVHS